MWIEEFNKLLFSNLNTNESTIKAALLKEENMPKVLYKYRRITDDTLEALSNNYLMAVAPSELNDPD